MSDTPFETTMDDWRDDLTGGGTRTGEPIEGVDEVSSNYCKSRRLHPCFKRTRLERLVTIIKPIFFHLYVRGLCRN